MAESRYQIFLFDSHDEETRAPSKARSFDLYFDNRFILGEYFPGRWNVEKKRLLIEKIINEIEKQRLLKKYKKTSKRKYRQQSLRLEDQFDYKLVDGSNRVIGDGQWSKAYGFRLYEKDNKTKAYKLHSEWDFSHPRAKSSVKKRELIAVIGEPEKKTPSLYKVTYKTSKPFLAWSVEPSYAKFRIITFTTPQPLEIVMGKLDDKQKNLLKEVFQKEWKKEWTRTQDSTRDHNMRIFFHFYDKQGEIVRGATGNQLFQYASTSRWRLGQFEDGQELYDDMVDQIEETFSGYLASNNVNAGAIGGFIFETRYQG